jgi:hypothetical protein|tara:strand:+ start:33904 stop:34143 length:240 start_codon:yes stop_codon:yes gene_type:complete
MTNKEEMLIIFMEECAEASIEASKIMRFNKGPDLLESEIGDIMCMIKLLAESGEIDMDAVELCADVKREKLKKWSDLDL